MDEVSLLIDLVSSNWSSSVTTLISEGKITADHAGTPNFVDVRTLDKNRGVRYDLTAKDVIIFFEDSQNLEYPTIHFDVRHETYSFTMHIRTIHDERAGGSKFNQIFVGSRSESNDRAKRLFGYKLTVEAKRFALSIP